MTTLTEFLLARIAEDEARVDTIPEWYCTESARGEGWGSRGDCDLCGKYMFDGTESVTKEAFWEHMESVHRRRFRMAECEAKRRIVALHSRCHSGYGLCSDRTYSDGPCDTLRALALPHADHPDYDESWRP